MTFRFIVPLIAVGVSISCMKPENQNSANKLFRYLPLGDSYTIGTGGTEGNSYPDLLTRHLNDSGFSVTMVDNPARNGFTTVDLIEVELPVFFQTKPDFVTICIGTNDWCIGRDSADFHDNLKYILDTIQANLKVKTNIVLLTVPDFSLTRVGPMYSGGRNISTGLQLFNQIIRAEADQRGLRTVDIFEISQAIKTDYNLISEDDLHPSDKGYALWEKSLLPVVADLLKEN